MTAPPLPFSFPVDVVHLPAAGRVYTLAADAQTRADVAAHLEIPEVGRLSAALTIMPLAGGNVDVIGRFDADVVQTCVVSLQPLPATLSVEVHRRFAPPPRPVAPADGAAKASKVAAKGKADKEPEEGWIDPHEEVADPIVNGQIDLGAVVVEELSLALDPYPRAPGATFQKVGEGVQLGGETGRESPFAVLAGLKSTPRAVPSSRRTPKNRPKTRR